MKIEKEYYVLIRLGTEQKNIYRPNDEEYKNETIYLKQDSDTLKFSYTDNIENAVKGSSRRAILEIKTLYERAEHKCEDSGFVPILVKKTIVW